MPEISNEDARAVVSGIAPLHAARTTATSSMRTMPMPADANGNGDIFGGWIMAQVDIAGAVLPARIAKGRIVTVAVNQFVFKQPVSMGDLLSFYVRVERIGKTSVTVNVEVFAERNPADLHVVKVTEANLTYVAIDGQGPAAADRRRAERERGSGRAARSAAKRQVAPRETMRPPVGVGEVRAEDEHVAVGLLAQEAHPGRERLLGVGIEARLDARVAALDRVVHQVAGDHRLGARRADANADVARRVAGSRLEADLVGDRVASCRPSRPGRRRARARSNRRAPRASCRRRPRRGRRSRGGSGGSARAGTSAPSGRRRGACSSRRGRSAGGCTARHRRRRARSRRPRSRRGTGRSAAIHAGRSRTLSLPTQVSTTIVLPRDSTTNAWIDAIRRPSAVAKCGLSHACDCTVSALRLENRKRRRHAGEERRRRAARLDDPRDGDVADPPASSGQRAVLTPHAAIAARATCAASASPQAR